MTGGAHGQPWCRGCGGVDLVTGEQVAYGLVWERLEQDFSASFGDDVRSRHTPASSMVVYTCRTCDVQSFHPAVAGGVDFYERLSRSPAYYEQRRWEFGIVAGRLSPGGVVVDVGSGPGVFLAMARQRGCRAVAVETNPSATAELRRKGLAVHATARDVLEAVGQVDVVTAFQVVEHVEDVTAFLQETVELVAPGGSLNISVPNRERVGRAAFEPLDHPPHHLTRWSADALAILAARHDLTLQEVLFEGPDPSGARIGARLVVDSMAKSWPMPARRFLVRAAGRVASRQPTHGLLTRTRVFARAGVHGHTILASYRKLG